jgi:hypothetical protein
VAQKDKVEAPGGHDMKHPFLVPAVWATLAAGAVVGALSVSGIFQVILIVLAVLLSVYTAISYMAVVLDTILNRPRR